MSRQSPIEASEEDVIEIDFIILWLGKMCLCDILFYILTYVVMLVMLLKSKKTMVYLARQELSAASCASE